MRDAESRFANSIQRAAGVRSFFGGSRVTPGTSTGFDGSSAPASRGLLIALLGAFALAAAFAPSASAALRHPSQSISFGSSGVSGSTFGKELKSIAYDQNHHRLYALVNNGAEEGRIFGFENPSAGVYTPMANFPVSVPRPYFEPKIAVDNTNGPTSGRIYYLLQWTYHQYIYAFEPNGSAVGGAFPIDLGEGYELNTNFCGLTTDSSGNIWMGVKFKNKVAEYSPSGGLVQEIPLQISSPCNLAFDSSTNDLYVSEGNSRVWRFTSASGYSTRVGPFDNNVADVAVDSSTHTMFTPRSYFGNAAAYTPQAQRLEYIGEGKSAYYVSAAVDESTGEVLLADGNNGNVIRVFPSVVVPDVTTSDPLGNYEVGGSISRAGAGEITGCYFEYATASYFNSNGGTYDQEEPCSPPAPFDEDRSVTADLSSVLTAETPYHYRLVAENATGTGVGADKVIEPHNVVSLSTEEASEISRTTAQLNASFEGTNDDTEYYFEWQENSSGSPGSCPCSNSTTIEDAGATNGPTEISTELTGLTAGKTYSFRVVAENSSGVSKAQTLDFTTSPAVKDLTTEAATEVKVDRATLNASLDPDGYATTYYFQWGRDTNYGQAIPLPPGDSVSDTAAGTKAVSELVTDLEPGKTYHFRIVATNTFGTTIGADESFSTPQPPSITALTTTNVTASTADLVATVNPNGYATTYYFEYGLTKEYGNRVPIPDGTLEASTEGQEFVQTIEGLEEKTYHFRLVAENEWGRVNSEDQTFNFNVPTGCPNQLLRQQTGAAYLPDCRAYEIVSAEEANGAAIFAEGPSSPYATGRLSYSALLNAIPGAGEPQNGELYARDLYMASRHQDGWETKYIGIPGSQGLVSSSAPGGEYGGQMNISYGSEGVDYPNAAPADKTLSHILVWDRKGKAILNQPWSAEGTNAPNVYDNEGHLLGQLPTNLAEVPGADKDLIDEGWIGSARINPEYTHYFFSSIRTAFAPGGVTERPGSVYDDNLATGSISIISKTESGANIPADPSAGYSNEFLRVLKTSDDASHALISAAAPPNVYSNPPPRYNHLYMAVRRSTPDETGDEYDHYDISINKTGENVGVHFEAMTTDGSKVYFTTDHQMTADDTDTSVDLYVWSEATNSLTRVSDSGNVPGNTDSCSASWTSKCNVEVVPIPGDGFDPYNEKGSDSAFATDSGEIYFFSPEQLDGARGVLNKRNLYVYRDGRAQYVDTLEPNASILRINVSPDGNYMALVTKTRLTAYNNAGHAMMYVYNATNRTLKCVSCLPSGEPPAADVQASLNGAFMTFDGRAFWSTTDGLVAQDANKGIDVYEFAEGRPQLISTGTGDNNGSEYQPAGLVSVSGDGIDVMFATFQTLVPQDQNGEVLKFYDARTNGGFAVAVEKPPCAAADECHGEDSAAPKLPEVGTAAYLGSNGNFKVHRHKKGRRHSKRKRCRKGKHHKKCRHRRVHHRHRKSHRRRNGHG